jgi:uncharacterized membrane protein
MHSIEAAIRINAPLDQCFQAWMDFEKFPTFMRRVVSVKRAAAADMMPMEGPLERYATDPQKDAEGVSITEVMHEVAAHGDQVWHWEVKGPLGQLFDWTAGIVMNLPNQAISWSTLSGEQLPNSGTVNFLKVPPSHPAHAAQTLVTITMTFSAPTGGIVGEFLSDAIHYGDSLLYDALEDFKRYIEQTPPVASSKSETVELI